MCLTKIEKQIEVSKIRQAIITQALKTKRVPVGSISYEDAVTLINAGFTLVFEGEMGDLCQTR